MAHCRYLFPQVRMPFEVYSLPLKVDTTGKTKQAVKGDGAVWRTHNPKATGVCWSQNHVKKGELPHGNHAYLSLEYNIFKIFKYLQTTINSSILYIYLLCSTHYILSAITLHIRCFVIRA